MVKLKKGIKTTGKLKSGVKTTGKLKSGVKTTGKLKSGVKTTGKLKKGKLSPEKLNVRALVRAKAKTKVKSKVLEISPNKSVPPKKTIDCARKVLNFSSITLKDRFDKKSFDPESFLDNLKKTSPSLIAMLSNIRKIDRDDFKKYGKVFKHYIYSGVTQGYGAKIIASAFIAAGYLPVFKKKGSSIVIDPDFLHAKDESKFAVLSSTAIYNTPTTLNTAKEIINTFNQRPDNIYGKNIRFIISDSGFKEGVDLFDVKYCHIFEDQLYASDLTQAEGRALRFRGQCGLPYNKGKGWTLQVYNYSVAKIESKWYNVFNFEMLKNKKSIIKQLQEQDPVLKFQLSLQKNLTKLIEETAIDHDLNKNVNDYTPKGSSIVWGTVLGIATITTLGLLAYNKMKN
mgnify:CR=1 FL=1